MHLRQRPPCTSVAGWRPSDCSCRNEGSDAPCVKRYELILLHDRRVVVRFFGLVLSDAINVYSSTQWTVKQIYWKRYQCAWTYNATACLTILSLLTYAIVVREYKKRIRMHELPATMSTLQSSLQLESGRRICSDHPATLTRPIPTFTRWTYYNIRISAVDQVFPVDSEVCFFNCVVRRLQGGLLLMTSHVCKWSVLICRKTSTLSLTSHHA